MRMKEKFGVGDMVMVNGMSGLPAEVVEVGLNGMRRVRFNAGDIHWVDTDTLRSCAPPKFKVGDEVRSSVGGFPVTPTVVEAVDLMGNGAYRYTVGGAYFEERNLRLSEYKFKTGDAVLVKGTLQSATVVGRKLMTSGKQEYTIEFSDGKVDYRYAEELTKELWPRTKVKVGDRVSRSGSTVVGTVLNVNAGLKECEVRWADGKVSWSWISSLRLKPRKITEDVPGAPEVLREGDRVRLRTDRKGGTVQRGVDGSYVIQWGGSRTVEVRSMLVVMYAPRPEEQAWHPLQAAVEGIDAERADLVKQVEAVQAKLAETKKAKAKLLDKIREDAVGS